MKRVLLCLSLLILNYGILFAEEQITITTYYPSPYGSYDSLQADKFGVGDNNGDGSLTSADVPTTSGDTWIKGKVGIGTMTPGGKLDVFVASTDAATKPLQIGKGTAGNYLSILNNGNVGIGTTAPNRRLTIQSSGTRSTNSQYLYLRQPDDYGYSFNLDDLTTGRMYLRGVNNGVESDILTLDRSNGNVGIGTTSPGSKLTVAGSIAGGETSTGWVLGKGAWGPDNWLRLTTTQGGSTYHDLAVNQSWASSNAYFANGTGIWNSSNNVGIGTTNPNSKLEIVGGALQVNMGNNNNYFNVNYDNNIGLELRSGTSGGTPYIDFANDATSDFDSRIILNGSVLQIENPRPCINTQKDVLFLANACNAVSLSVDTAPVTLGVWGIPLGGWAHVKAAAFDIGSDIRLKKNIKTLTGVLDRLDKVRGVSFNWKSDNEQAIGVIAQEMETVFPEVVITDKPGHGKGNIPGEKFVSYGGVSAIALQGLKELKAEVRAQAEEIKTLKQRLDVLEKK